MRLIEDDKLPLKFTKVSLNLNCLFRKLTTLALLMTMNRLWFLRQLFALDMLIDVCRTTSTLGQLKTKVHEWIPIVRHEFQWIVFDSSKKTYSRRSLTYKNTAAKSRPASLPDTTQTHLTKRSHRHAPLLTRAVQTRHDDMADCTATHADNAEWNPLALAPYRKTWDLIESYQLVFLSTSKTV